jgi:hypothetical protein
LACGTRQRQQANTINQIRSMADVLDICRMGIG